MLSNDSPNHSQQIHIDNSKEFSWSFDPMLLTESSGRKKCLIGCSGSVATVKVPELAVTLSSHYDVLIVASSNALFFLERSQQYNSQAWKDFLSIGGIRRLIRDEDEWKAWDKMGDDVLHIVLRRWADIFVIAPASANLLGKAASGVTDNLLLSIMRAWDLQNSTKPCILCPAMNTVMWDHPATAATIEVLTGWGWMTVGPVEKMLACQERGNGAMASVSDIVQAVNTAFQSITGQLKRTSKPSPMLNEFIATRNLSLIPILFLITANILRS
jgi:phosphopantothenoylcysteine decarboxylase